MLSLDRRSLGRLNVLLSPDILTRFALPDASSNLPSFDMLRLVLLFDVEFLFSSPLLSLSRLDLDKLRRGLWSLDELRRRVKNSFILWGMVLFLFLSSSSRRRLSMIHSAKKTMVRTRKTASKAISEIVPGCAIQFSPLFVVLSVPFFFGLADLVAVVVSVSGGVVDAPVFFLAAARAVIDAAAR